MFHTPIISASLGLAVALAFAAPTARAQFGYGYGRAHLGVHQDLGHREFHRQQHHAWAHSYPMTPGTHFRLHQDLNHDRYHDGLRHEQFHLSTPRPWLYGPTIIGRPGCTTIRRGVSLGYSPYGMSLRLGF